MLNSSSSREDRVKFLREAAIMGQFRHKNVVALYGVVTVGEPVRNAITCCFLWYLLFIGDADSRIGWKRRLKRSSDWRQSEVNCNETRTRQCSSPFFDSLVDKPSAEEDLKLARLLLRSCSEIAEGMKYLSRKGFVHRVGEDEEGRSCMSSLFLDIGSGCSQCDTWPRIYVQSLSLQQSSLSDWRCTFRLAILAWPVT